MERLDDDVDLSTFQPEEAGEEAGKGEGEEGATGGGGFRSASSSPHSLKVPRNKRCVSINDAYTISLGTGEVVERMGGGEGGGGWSGGRGGSHKPSFSMTNLPKGVSRVRRGKTRRVRWGRLWLYISERCGRLL